VGIFERRCYPRLLFGRGVNLVLCGDGRILYRVQHDDFPKVVGIVGAAVFHSLGLFFNDAR